MIIDGMRATDRTVALVLAFYAAFNRRDWAGVLATLSEDVRHDVNQGGRESGRAAFQAFLPGQRPLWRGLSSVVSVACGLGYFIGFTPPSWLRRLWQAIGLESTGALPAPLKKTFETQVGPTAPPAFLVHSRLDRKVVFHNSELYYDAMLAADRPGTAFLCEVGLGGRLDCANALDAANGAKARRR